MNKEERESESKKERASGRERHTYLGGGGGSRGAPMSKHSREKKFGVVQKNNVGCSLIIGKCVCICVYMCVYMCVCVCISVCAYMYIYT